MSQWIAEIVVGLLGAYGIAGLLCSIPLLIAGIARIDPRTKGTGIGFRLVIWPGVVIMWPLLLSRWLKQGASI